MNTREIFRSRLEYFIQRSGKNKKQISEEMGIPYTTLVEWANGKRFPRADGIEMLANYFNILKSDLLEEKDEINETHNINVVKIVGRDGRYIEKRLTDEQVKALEAIIEQLPDVPDDL